MVPLQPFPIHSFDIIEENYTYLPPKESREPFTLFVTSPRLLTVPTTFIDIHIVVVGTSNTALSLLHTLFYKTNMNNRLIFNKVTLISDMTIKEKLDPLQNMIFVQTSNITQRMLQETPLEIYCNFIKGLVVKIDRNNRHLYLHDRTIVYYDKLILACGKQFQVIEKVEPLFGGERTHFQPINVFALNTMVEVKAALKLTMFSLRKLKEESENFGKIANSCLLCLHFR